jgi:hypothetical protein
VDFSLLKGEVGADRPLIVTGKLKDESVGVVQTIVKDVSAAAIWG